ncbi:type I-E CRISPR-associated protein Cse1/CasA [Schaalia sp. ZJ1691]|uniref:type I-E CRISPR-associated protein Cse1/CasA n=1 Tax=Schaalia sp. ZJ1691 TaxID=2709404 RepID=UPI0013EB1219|nr:type I-E CRISPR-associated protein Cse1/CasA [Schaalia sp. ZJ1691]
MSSTFNLLDEKWIRVSLLDGTTDELSLLEVFTHARDIAAIHGELACQDVAVLRLILAIAHRTMGGPQDLKVWREYWITPGKLGKDATGYLESFRNRFDIRDATMPFFQVAGIHAKSGKTSGLESFILDVPNGAPFFTTRLGKGLEKMSWAEAARWLINIHAFDPSGIRTGAVGDPAASSGRGYPIGPGWAGQIGNLYVRGNNLEETLLRNTVVPLGDSNLRIDYSRDLPPWEDSPDTPVGSLDLQPTGPVSCYTWQTRRILLHGDDSGVTSVFIGNGDKATPQNRQLFEPMTSWRYSEPQSTKRKITTYMPRKLPTDQALWRGLPSIITGLTPPPISPKKKGASSVAPFFPPATVKFNEQLIQRRLLPKSGLLPIHAVGVQYGSQEAVVEELVDDELAVPSAILDEENIELAGRVRDAMELTEQVALLIKNFASNLARAAGGDPETQKAERLQASSTFYVTIDEAFPQWLASLDATDPLEAFLQWKEILRHTAWQLHEELAAAAPESAYAGRTDGRGRIDVGSALSIFRRSLGKVLPHSTDQSNNNEERSKS